MASLACFACATSGSTPTGCGPRTADPEQRPVTKSATPPSAKPAPTIELRGNLDTLWANDGGDKVTQGDRRASGKGLDVRNSVWDGARVRLFGARNEVVAFNLVFEAPSDSPVTEVSVTFDALTNDDGERIESKPASGAGVFNWVGRNIELFYVRYLQIRGLSKLSYLQYDERHIPERFRRKDGKLWTDRPDHDQYYPDIAVPLELVGAFDIAAKQSQSVWVDIYIPKTAKPGRYGGVVSIKEADVVVAEVPVELDVRAFTLPDTPASKTMLNLGYGDINQRYLGEPWPTPGTQNHRRSRAILDKHFQVAHRHRISLIDANPEATSDRPIDAWIPRLDGTLFTERNGYDGPGRATSNDVFSIGTYGSWNWKDEGEAGMRKHTDAWVRWFDRSFPDTEYFLYLIDEPGAELLPKVEQWAQWIDRNPGPGSTLKSLATVPFPVARDEIPALDIPAAWPGPAPTAQWEAVVDWYAGKSDKRLYMYNGRRPYSGSFAIEDDGVALRELAWGQYKKGIDRWFFWESTYYRNYQGGAGQTDLFRSAQTFGGTAHAAEEGGETGWNYSNGDGVLFYPGTDTEFPKDSYRVPGPFASLRLKQWRRGIQDVDYLVMASQVNPERVAEIVETIVPKALWEYGVTEESDPTWVRADISWSTDPDVWEKARAELADIIESGR